MDLWVRSQDRRALYKTSGFFIREEQYKRKGKYIIEGNECWLGAYNTFERALEVLDEIHGCIQTNAGFEMYSNLGQFSDDFNKKYNLVPVYLMPKE